MKLIVLSLLLLSITAFASIQKKYNFADSHTLDKQKLVLNGIGIRKATFLKIEVYVGGLYTEKKMKDPKAILSNESPKFIRMHFVRDVDGEDMQEGWSEAFENSGANLKKLKKPIDDFLGLQKDIKKGEEVLISFLKDKVNIKYGPSAEKTIAGKGFPAALLAVWFVNAEDEGLRDGLLGLKNQ